MTAGGQETQAWRAALACLDALYGYAISVSRNPADAEDLVQETYTRAAQALARLAPESNVKSWLFKILLNIWRNHKRRQTSGPQFVSMSDEQHESDAYQARSDDDPLAACVTRATRAALYTAIEQLPPEFREVIILRDFQELSYQEIAEILGCPSVTVGTRLFKARQKLRVMLSAQACRFNEESGNVGQANEQDVPYRSFRNT